jgi:ATP-dependent Clp protease adaptor protein ClpS
MGADTETTRRTTTETETETTRRTTTDTEFIVVTEDELEKPYRVMIENDEVTPMDFVVVVLHKIFQLSAEDAVFVMLQAHYFGKAHVTTLPYEEARQRVYDAHSLARAQGYPLSFFLEAED